MVMLAFGSECRIRRCAGETVHRLPTGRRGYLRRCPWLRATGTGPDESNRAKAFSFRKSNPGTEVLQLRELQVGDKFRMTFVIMLLLVLVVFWGFLGSGVWGYHGYRTIIAIFVILACLMQLSLRGSVRRR